MDDATLRAAFDEQVRRRTRADTPGEHAERAGAVVRRVATDGSGWSGITWSGLAGPDAADRVIAAQVRYFAGLGLPFEWKLYDYDPPPTWAAGWRRPGSCPTRRRLCWSPRSGACARALPCRTG